MSKEDQELISLCKQVYEKTGWKYGYAIRDNPKMSAYDDTNVLGYMYTSDCLLEKLPFEIRNQTIEVVGYAGHWEAAYSGARDSLWDTTIKSHGADTPLKALLKLTVALAELEELKGGE